MINQVWHGDCLQLMHDIPDGSIDMILTDIPYNEVNRVDSGLRNLDKGNADVLTFDLEKMLIESMRVCNGSFYIFCGIEQVSEIRGFYVEAGCTTRLCIWEKTNPSPMNGQHVWLSGIECCVYAKKAGATFNEHCKNTVFRYPIQQGTLHPTMKPVPLFERLIMASTNAGDTVLDNCAGSGTTAIACIKTDRNYILIEQEQKYIDIINKRISQETAQGRLF